MQLLFFFALAVCVRGAAYTYRFQSNENMAWFSEVTKAPGTQIKLSFYVDPKSLVRLVVLDPNKKPVKEIKNKSSGKVVIDAKEVGEYSFFFGKVSGYTLSLLDFDLFLQTPSDDNYDNLGKRHPELENGLIKLKKELNSLRNKMRELKSHDVKNTGGLSGINKAVGIFSLFELILIILIAFFQVVVLRSFFSPGGNVRL